MLHEGTHQANVTQLLCWSTSDDGEGFLVVLFDSIYFYTVPFTKVPKVTLSEHVAIHYCIICTKKAHGTWKREMLIGNTPNFCIVYMFL